MIMWVNTGRVPEDKNITVRDRFYFEILEINPSDTILNS